MRTIFKMTGPANAVLHEGDQKRAVPIPANAMVVLLDGNISEDAVVKIPLEAKFSTCSRRSFVNTLNCGDSAGGPGNFSLVSENELTGAWLSFLTMQSLSCSETSMETHWAALTFKARHHGLSGAVTVCW
jgi:hypothetical protein